MMSRWKKCRKVTLRKIVDAVAYFIRLKSISSASLFVVAVSLMLAGLGFGLKLITPKLRTRNKVESLTKVMMMLMYHMNLRPLSHLSAVLQRRLYRAL